ncbi:MAG TPA: ketoacyl-ACP synthase III [Polyangiaceae bacterium]|nr:ketoacyl-ACP synthase III [Polyangiaceae bacterium]
MSLATYLPRRRVDNAAMLSSFPELDEKDLERIGVSGRHEAAEDEDVPTMAVNASRAALERANLSAEALDFLILVNWSERRYVPDIAPRVQAMLGARKAFAFDVGCACAGFVYALSVAHGYLQNPRFQRGLVVASDHSRRRVRAGSRASLLFGDAAAAAVVASNVSAGFNLIDYELGTDGNRSELMDVDTENYLVTHVRQREVNELAVSSLVRAGKNLLARQGLTFSDVDYIVPHSGTAGIQTMLAEALSLPRQKILTNLPSVGNVTAASIPTALEHFLQNGTLRTGQLVLVLAVGVGWHYVAGLIEL